MACYYCTAFAKKTSRIGRHHHHHHIPAITTSFARVGTWTAEEPAACITACGTAEGSGTPGAVTCSTGSDAGCYAADKPAAKTCHATPDCGARVLYRRALPLQPAGWVVARTARSPQ